MAADDGDATRSTISDSLARALAASRSDTTHGASYLARAAARALAAAAALAAHEAERTVDVRLREIHAAARAFAAARPSMAVVANTVACLWAAALAAGDDARTQLAAIRAEAERVELVRAQAAAAIVDAIGQQLGGVVYTHSRSDTVEDVLVRLIRRGQLRRVWVSQSHPGDEGVALAARLAREGAAITLVADAGCGVFAGEAETVLLGADSVRDDGSLVNKVGSYPLALAARAAQVPVYVACETRKIAAPRYPLVLEEMDARALLPAPVAGVDVRNVTFDHTPACLLAGIATEAGLLERAAVAACARQAGARLDALMAQTADA